MDQATMPLTAKQALEQWKSGKPLPAFQIEGDPDRQEHIYAAAFAMIAGQEEGEPYDLTANLKDLQQAILAGAIRFELTEREFHTAHSIAFVAMKVGWAKMVSQHVHRDSPAITIQKPE